MMAEPLASRRLSLHNGRAVGDVPVKLAVFYAGAVGQALTTKEAHFDAATTLPTQ
jgi:hypothetical protein